MLSRMDLYHRSDSEPQAAPSRSRSSRHQAPVLDSQRSVEKSSSQPMSREQLREEQLPPAPKLKKIPPILKPSALLAIALLTVGLMGTLGHKSYSVHNRIVQADKHRDHDTAIDSSNLSIDDDEHSKSSSSAKKHSKSASEHDSSSDDQTDQDAADQQAQDSDTDASSVSDDDNQQSTNQHRSAQRQTQAYNQQPSHHRQSSQADDNQSTYQTGGSTQQTQTNQSPADNADQATYTVPNTGGDNQ